ncbi:MAG: hypothetical protein E7584_03675 [Ruminococcaceae bacterium]|nr:hypothetical protein [Oscillospiraceae bacterium]
MKKVWIAIAIIGIIAAIALIGAPYIKDWLANTNAKDEKPIEEQAKEALQSVIDEAVFADENPNEVLSQTEERNGFEILSFSETETGGVARVRIYAPDLYTMAKELDEKNEYVTEEELKNAIVDAIDKAELVEREVILEFQATENGYEPILTMEFFDAYYGGVLKLLDEALSKNNEEATQ